RRAAEWYRAHGLLAEAVEQALDSRDQQFAALLIAQAAGQAIRDGRLETLLHWFDRLPNDLVRAEQALSIYKGWGLWLRGDADAAASYAQSAQRVLAPATTSPLPGRLLGLRACVSGPDGCKPGLVHEALAALDGVDPLFHALVLLQLAYQQLGSSTMSDMIRVLQALAELGQRGGARFIFGVTRSLLAQVHLARGERRAALAVCQSALDELADEAGQPVTGPLLIASGRVAYAANDQELAKQQLETGLALVERLGYAPARIEGRVALAWLQLASGQAAEAFATLAAARDIARHMHLQSQLDELTCVEAMFQLRLGDSAAAEAALRSLALLPTTQEGIANHRCALSAKTYARVLLAHEQPAEAREVLARTIQWERSVARDGDALTTAILLSLADQKLGDLPQAQATLAQAIGAAAREGAYRVFLDEGRTLASLLPSVQQVAPSFVDELLSAFNDEFNSMEQAPAERQSFQTRVRPVTHGAPSEPLSDREREILRLIATGMPNAAVARVLIIAPGTVKKHLDHIYGKLGAHNRTAAVARARQLDLLG
ncbi:MAG TPA: LuxR C-terminal-related transcriptional regulator, partial [Roseiflexaceae bacterium]|nr:LuxR C-terminal-related transcriptional regulator [Roseiflexaceae bacterium]